MPTLDQRIESLLALPPFSGAPAEREPPLLEALKNCVEYSCERLEAYARYVRQWPADYRSASRLSELPYLPVAALKADPPLRLVPEEQVTRTVASSATTGQVPSRAPLDAATARRMTRGAVSILRDFIGPRRRPFLIVDGPPAGDGRELGARAAAIHALLPFASETCRALVPDGGGGLRLDEAKVREFAAAHRADEVLVYGFTFMLWERLVAEAGSGGLALGLPGATVLHSGGWKRLQEQAVGKEAFNGAVARAVGCAPARVIDFYGMAENVGVVYPDCAQGNKHAPAFAAVIVRDPLTLAPVAEGGRGLIQVCSALPTSFPGHLLLTEDLADVVVYDGCPCGRRGIAFRFAGRAPRAEARGCGNGGSRR